MMNIESFKGRTINPNNPVKVYRNLNRKGVWFSLRDAKTGLVVAHARDVMLENGYTEVKEKDRLRVVKEKRKNVHAFIVGYVRDIVEVEGMEPARYNPYKYDSFVDGEEKPINKIKYARLNAEGVNVVKGE